MLSIGDTVIYVGQKFSDLSTKRGLVEGYVQGSPGVVVVSYGDDSYILNRSSLCKPRADDIDHSQKRKR